MATVKKSLKLECVNNNAQSSIITLPNPKSDLDADAVKAVKSRFSKIGLTIKSYYVVETETSEKISV